MANAIKRKCVVYKKGLNEYAGAQRRARVRRVNASSSSESSNTSSKVRLELLAVLDAETVRETVPDAAGLERESLRRDRSMRSCAPFAPKIFTQRV